MTRVSVLDAWAILALLQAEEPAASRVRSLLASYELGDGERRPCMSVMNLGEVYYRVGRSRSLEAAESVLRLLHDLPIRFMPATDARVLAAARIKSRLALSYADAFAAALAAEVDGTLLTGDPELVAAAPNAGFRVEALTRTV